MSDSVKALILIILLGCFVANMVAVIIIQNRQIRKTAKGRSLFSPSASLEGRGTPESILLAVLVLAQILIVFVAIFIRDI